MILISIVNTSVSSNSLEFRMLLQYVSFLWWTDRCIQFLGLLCSNIAVAVYCQSTPETELNFPGCNEFQMPYAQLLHSIWSLVTWTFNFLVMELVQKQLRKTKKSKNKLSEELRSFGCPELVSWSMFSGRCERKRQPHYLPSSQCSIWGCPKRNICSEVKCKSVSFAVTAAFTSFRV